ncbi:hypothetical protein MRX96_000387 [Rhipicephalus microplus]
MLKTRPIAVLRLADRSASPAALLRPRAVAISSRSCVRRATPDGAMALETQSRPRVYRRALPVAGKDGEAP